MSKPVIAFIGLGNMGLPMANNLAAAGFRVHGYDAACSKPNELAHADIIQHTQLSNCVADASVIFTMLPDGAVVLDVLKLIIDARDQSATIIDCSTIDINDAREAHRIATENGHTFFDAPVSGGIKGAAAGTLTAMVGGHRDSLAILDSVLDCLFANIIYCGGAGNGQAAKICNNMLLATTMIGASETFNLGEQLGLDAQTLFDVLSTSTGSCWAVNSYCPVPGVGPQSPADNRFQPGFSSQMMLKDMKLTQAAANSTEVATPLGAQSLALYEAYVQQHGGSSDFSAIIKYLQTLQRQS